MTLILSEQEGADTSVPPLLHSSAHMSLEQEIQQTKSFANQKHKVVVNILFTHAWLQGQLREWLRPFDLTSQQYNVIRILRGSYPNPLSTSDIRERMLDKMSDASRIVDRLHNKGVLKRTVCPTDRRLVDVVITDVGLAILQRIDDTESSFDRIIGSISETEAEEMNGLLDRIRESQR